VNDRPNESLQIASGILAVVAPGLGHAALGHARRGALIATGVLGLFLSGLLIGGVDAVDSKNDPWWFVGQALVGPPAFAADWVNRSLSANDPAETASEGWRDAQQPSREKSFAHSNEMGMLFITIAGMLNLIAIIDAFWNAPAVQKDRRGVIGDLEGGAR